jgi:hypothetical protein
MEARFRIASVGGGALAVLVVVRAWESNAEWSPDGREVSYTLRRRSSLRVTRERWKARQLTRSGDRRVTNALIRRKKVSYKSPDGFTIRGLPV